MPAVPTALKQVIVNIPCLKSKGTPQKCCLKGECKGKHTPVDFAIITKFWYNIVIYSSYTYSMSPVLYLTAEERALYDKLSESLHEGWRVEAEMQAFSDSPEKRQARADIIRIHDPRLKAFRDAAMQTKTEGELSALMDSTDVSAMNDDDLTSLFFVLGPDALSAMITTFLSQAKDDAAIETASALSMLRHSLLGSLIRNA